MLLLVPLTIVLPSCNKDEPPVFDHENYFKVGTEVQLDLKQGFILDYGNLIATLPDSRHMHVDLISNGLTYNATSGDFEGQGDRVGLGIFTDKDHYLPSGTYTFDDTNSSDPFTFDGNFIWEDYNTSDHTGHRHDIVDGTIIVINNTNSNTDYDFKFDCLLSTGSRFVGTFKGKCSYEDME